MMRVVPGPGSVVLNQNPDNPMSGVVQAVRLEGREVIVRWADGKVFAEQPSDLILTGALVLVEVPA